MRSAFLSALAVAVLATGASAAATSGLRGRVTLGPTTPVCTVSASCSRPDAGVMITFTRSGVSRRTRTRRDGSYRIALSPGTYRVSIAGAHFGYSPRTAVVRNGAVSIRNFAVDTGIR